MIAERRGYLDYYGDHGVVPVSQSHISLDLQLRRRTRLYESVGLPPSAFRGSSILEVGPGTGDNATILAHFEPASIALMDANPASISAIVPRLKKPIFRKIHTRVIDVDFNAYTGPRERFDIVIAEGCIPGQVDPRQSLRTIANWVSEFGGALVITCSDPISVLSELCRRLIRIPIHKIAGGSHSLAVEIAGRYFAKDLQTLPGATRTPEDYVTDAILHPWPRDWHLSLDEALDVLNEFRFLGSNPSFLNDWHWYKDESWTSSARNTLASVQWKSISLFNVDHRVQFDPQRPVSADMSSEMFHLSHAFSDSVDQMWTTGETNLLNLIVDLLGNMGRCLSRDDRFDITVASLAEFSSNLPLLMAGDLSPELNEFRSWWGRGQQYLSVTRGTPVRDHY